MIHLLVSTHTFLHILHRQLETVYSETLGHSHLQYLEKGLFSMQWHKKSTRLEASCTSPSLSSGTVSRTRLKDSWDAFRQILPRRSEVTFLAYSWSSVAIRQTKMWLMSQWWGDAVVQSVKALLYKPKVCRFDSRWSQ